MTLPSIPALPKPGVLLFNLPPEREAPVRRWLAAHDVTVRIVRPEEQGCTLGYLTGMPGADAAREGGAPFTGELLVMSLFPRPLLDDFLQFFRDEGLAPIKLKAVVTPTNAAWSARKLYRALSKEHRALH